MNINHKLCRVCTLFVSGAIAVSLPACTGEDALVAEDIADENLEDGEFRFAVFAAGLLGNTALSLAQSALYDGTISPYLNGISTIGATPVTLSRTALQDIDDIVDGSISDALYNEHAGAAGSWVENLEQFDWATTQGTDLVLFKQGATQSRDDVNVVMGELVSDGSQAALVYQLVASAKVAFQHAIIDFSSQISAASRATEEANMRSIAVDTWNELDTFEADFETFLADNSSGGPNIYDHEPKKGTIDPFSGLNAQIMSPSGEFWWFWAGSCRDDDDRSFCYERERMFRYEANATWHKVREEFRDKVLGPEFDRTKRAFEILEDYNDGATPVEDECGVLRAGQEIYPGDTLEACGGGNVRLVFTSSGAVRVEFYHSGGGIFWPGWIPAWELASSASKLAMQGDGHLVAYGSAGVRYANGVTLGKSGAYLEVTKDAVLIKRDGEVLQVLYYFGAGLIQSGTQWPPTGNSTQLN